MRLKCNRYRLAAALPRTAHYLTENVRVRPMHSIKIPHADLRRPEVCGNFFEFVENLYQVKINRRARQARKEIQALYKSPQSLSFSATSASSAVKDFPVVSFAQSVLIRANPWPTRFQTPTLARHTIVARAAVRQHWSSHAPDRGKCA